MLLVIKLNFDDFQAYRQEFNKCLKYNCENTHIQEIILLTDLNINDIPKHTKLKHIVKRGISSTEAIDYAKRISKQDKIIFSNSFFIFTHELNRIDWNTVPIQTNNYTIFNRQTNYKMVNMSPQPSRDILKEAVDIHQLKENTIVTEVIRKKGELVKVEPKLNQQQLGKIDVVIVSVNYNDYLLLSLTNNTKLFSNITVVTSSDDLMCQRICEKFGVKCVITDRMYENGATFNKGKAINEGINSIENPGWILLLDADIVVEDKIDLKSLSWDHLYISDRWICTDYQRYKNYKSGEIPLESIGEYEVNKGLGFFQLFNASKERFFPETSEDAAWSDLMFRDKFSKRKDIENKIIHLGHAYKNWDGRVTSRFISDEEFHSLIPKDFDINEYFDKIYCLNLDRRSDRWENVKLYFEKNRIKVQRFSAIDGGNHSKNENIQGLSDNGLIENSNALACLKSHLSIIKDAKLKGYKKILIFEDDVLLSDNFSKKIRLVGQLDWKILYLGASQFDWEDISTDNFFYNCKNTLGTFAYAIDSSIYDEAILLFEENSKSVDNYLSLLQEKYKEESFVIFPNIVISDVEDSDIREQKDMFEYSTKMKWNLSDFKGTLNKLRVLLLPDVEGWAFDNIAKSIQKYNPYPKKIQYEIGYMKDIHKGQKIDYDRYDYIYVFFEGEKSVSNSKKIIRGCYSAFWLENQNYLPQNIAKDFNQCRGSIFANQHLLDSIKPFLKPNHETTIITDCSDENIFFPKKELKSEKFTAIFVGNSKRKIKNFSVIEKICQETEINLILCEDIEQELLVGYYNQADVCINFSDFEGGPQTFIESALCEVPMLIRSNNELSKLIPCFKGETKEDFIEIIKKLKANRKLCEEMGQQARKIVLSNFTYNSAAMKFSKFFLTL